MVLRRVSEVVGIGWMGLSWRIFRKCGDWLGRIGWCREQEWGVYVGVNNKLRQNEVRKEVEKR